MKGEFLFDKDRYKWLIIGVYKKDYWRINYGQQLKLF